MNIVEQTNEEYQSRKDYVITAAAINKNNLYLAYNNILSASAYLVSIDTLTVPLYAGESIGDRNVKISNTNDALVHYRSEYTSSLIALTELTDELNTYEPYTGFPQAGERIIRVGETLNIFWNSTLIPEITMYFMKGGTKIPVTVLKEDIRNKKSFVIDITHYSDEYLPCKIRVESSVITTIFDESAVFKVLKSN